MLETCPKCGYRRFDPVAGACERRQCAYEEATAAARYEGPHDAGCVCDRCTYGGDAVATAEDY